MIHYQKRSKKFTIMTTDFERYLFASARVEYYAGYAAIYKSEMLKTRSANKETEYKVKYDTMHRRSLFWFTTKKFFERRIQDKLSDAIKFPRR